MFRATWQIAVRARHVATQLPRERRVADDGAVSQPAADALAEGAALRREGERGAMDIDELLMGEQARVSVGPVRPPPRR